jgi:hypothetical protein
VLVYSLCHVDKFSKSYLRGEAYLPLFQIDLTDSRRRLQIPFVEIKVRILVDTCVIHVNKCDKHVNMGIHVNIGRATCNFTICVYMSYLPL